MIPVTSLHWYGSPTIAGAATLAGLILSTIALAALSFIFVERPAERYLRRRLARDRALREAALTVSS